MPNSTTDEALDSATDKPLGAKEFLRKFYPVLALVAAIEVVLWVHWNSLSFVSLKWLSSDKYSYGFLIPLIAVMLLWLLRDEKWEIVKTATTIGSVLFGVGMLFCAIPYFWPDLVQPLVDLLGRTVLEGIGVSCGIAGAFLLLQPRIDFAAVSLRDRWIGFGILLAAEAMRMAATYSNRTYPDLISFIPALAGVFIMVGGLKIMRWAGWPILFLVYMLPLPGVLDKHLSANLQSIATSSSAFLLQMGWPLTTHVGNDIYIGADGASITVAEACSGLKMLTIFGALSFVVALLCDRPVWQRIVIVVSSIPIALASNIIRITLTGVLYGLTSADQIKLHEMGHSALGLFMMPIGLLLLFIEYKILLNLVIEDDDDPLVPIGFKPPAAGPKLERIGGGTSGNIAKSTVAANTAVNPGVNPLSGSPVKRPPRERTPN